MPKPPHKSLCSYLLPFALIVLLLGAGWFVIQNQLNLADFTKLFAGPNVKKQEKVKVAFSQGTIEIKPWRSQEWTPWAVQTVLDAGDSIRTSKDSVVVLRFFEASEVRIAELSEVKIVRMDMDQVHGNHLDLDLASGKLWRRGKVANTPQADFIISTPHFVALMNEASVVDFGTTPESLRCLAGSAMLTVTADTGTGKKAIKHDQLKAGFQAIWSPEVAPLPLDDDYLKSEWYLWNIDKEERLGPVAAPATPPPSAAQTPPAQQESLPEGLVTVTSPQANDVVARDLFVTGTYDAEKIEKIWIQDKEVTLGLDGAWERKLLLDEKTSSLTVTAQQRGESVKKLALGLAISVDAIGPALGKIKEPPVDGNGNGVLKGDNLTMVGEVAADAVRICVAHNDSEPYCLSKFKKGNATFTYSGAVKYGNVVKGKNKYTISAYDSFNNVTSKTVYYFKDIPKPAEKVAADPLAPLQGGITPTSQPNATSSELPKPVISSPDSTETFQSTDPTVVVTGTVDAKTQSILVNGKRASYKSGTKDFSFTYPLEAGENLIKVQAEDSQGNKSKSAVLTVMYLKSTSDTERP